MSQINADELLGSAGQDIGLAEGLLNTFRISPGPREDQLYQALVRSNIAVARSLMALVELRMGGK
jgi:hypothetical protein